MYTIKNAANRLGLTADTLRAWERRYGVGATSRTASGYRLYDETSLASLKLMKSLIDSGWATQTAADEVLRRTESELGANRTRSTTATAHRTPRTTSPPVGRPANRRAIRHQPKKPTPAAPGPDSPTLAQAAASMDTDALRRILDLHLSATSFEVAVDGWLLPSLRELGEAWERGECSVAGEHLASAAVGRRLAAAYDAAASVESGTPIVIGLPPGARHDLGLLAFGVAARRAGFATTWLGADVPVVDWVHAVELQGAAAAVLAVPMEANLEAISETIEALAAAHPELLIAVGGRAQDQAPTECLRLGHEIGPAAALLNAALAR